MNLWRPFYRSSASRYSRASISFSMPGTGLVAHSTMIVFAGSSACIVLSTLLQGSQSDPRIAVSCGLHYCTVSLRFGEEAPGFAISLERWDALPRDPRQDVRWLRLGAPPLIGYAFRRVRRSTSTDAFQTCDVGRARVHLPSEAVHGT